MELNMIPRPPHRRWVQLHLRNRWRRKSCTTPYPCAASMGVVMARNPRMQVNDARQIQRELSCLAWICPPDARGTPICHPKRHHCTPSPFYSAFKVRTGQDRPRTGQLPISQSARVAGKGSGQGTRDRLCTRRELAPMPQGSRLSL
jgi:hypothetical protein